MAQADVTVADHGTIVVLTPNTEAARAWFAENVAQDGPRWGGGYACDHRPGWAIVEGLEAEGFTLG